jgi:hypothetical protein
MATFWEFFVISSRTSSILLEFLSRLQHVHHALTIVTSALETDVTIGKIRFNEMKSSNMVVMVINFKCVSSSPLPFNFMSDPKIIKEL